MQRAMTGRILLGAGLLLALSRPALADDIAAQKHAVDSKISDLNGALTQIQEAQSSLRGQIDGISRRISTLELRVGDVSLQLASLEQDLGLRQQRLNKLNRLYHLQSDRLKLLTRQYKTAVDRLDQRLVAIYESPSPSTLDVVLGASSIQ